MNPEEWFKDWGKKLSSMGRSGAGGSLPAAAGVDQSPATSTGPPVLAFGDLHRAAGEFMHGRIVTGIPLSYS